MPALSQLVTRRLPRSLSPRRGGLLIIAAFVAQLAPAALAAPAAFAASSPLGDAATVWPTTWTAYASADGTSIVDDEGEPGISPDTIDVASNGGTAPSVFYAWDGTNAFFRIRLLGDPRDASKGGFDNAFWLVHVATAADDTLRAVVGLNGKPVSTDYVYTSDSVGGEVTTIFTTPFDSSGGQSSAGARGLADGSGQYFVDFQVPLARLTDVTGGLVTATTPIKFVFGSSQSANLATINKDFAPGTSADFEAAAPIRLSGSPTTTTTVSCTPADALTYQATTTCTATVMDQAATDATQPMGSISWAAVGGTLGTMACTLVGSGPSSSTCSVTFTATNPGPGSVSATYAGNMTHQGSDGSATLTINPAPLTISVQDESRAFGAGDPAFAVEYSGFVGGEDASVLDGVLSCVTNATAASAPGAYSIDCSGLVSGNYEITWQAGTLSVGLSQPTITSGTPPALTYGEQLPADPTGGDSASVPGTFSYQPLPGSFPNAGTVTVHVTFTPDDPGYAPVEYDVQVQVGRAPLTITAHDAERAQGEPNPELTAGYEGFVNGDDPGDLSGNLTCSTAAGLDSTPAAYAISCSGPSSDNYDINFVNGQLTVLEPATPLDTTAPSASDLRVSFITGSVITAKGFVPVRTSWSSTDDTGIASTTLQRALAGGKYVSVKTATCPSLLQSFDASFDASLKPRVMFRERAQSSDAAGNPSAWTSADPFVITDFQIHSTALTYTGTWKSKYGRSFWNGGHRFSAKSGNSVTLTTAGSSFAFVSSLGPNMGQVRVSVDGTPVETIDLYSPTTVERYVAWSRSFDAVGTHTVTIEVLGTRNSLSTDTRVTLDAFTTIGPSVVGGPPISG